MSIADILGSKRAMKVLAFILFSSIGFSIYSNTLRAPFQFDDYGSIIENSDVHLERLSLDGLIRLIASDRPVSMVSFALNYYFGGLDVFGYHAVNTVIHILTAFGLYLLLDLTLSVLFSWPEEKRSFASLLAAIFWMTNPIQTQAVTYIVQRMTSMAAMFYVYSIFFYAKGRLSSRRGRIFYVILSVLSGMLSIGAKQNAWLLPFFVFLFEICVLRKGNLDFIRDKRFYIPALVSLPLIFLVLINLYPKPFSALISPYPGMGYVIKERLFSQARVFFLYMLSFLFPIPSRLSVEHLPGLSRSLFNPATTLFAVTGVVSIITYSVISVKKRSFYAFFLLWLLGNMAIESLALGIGVMYEHRVYLSSMGIAAIIGKGVTEVLYDSRGRRWIVPLLSVLMVLMFSLNTYKRNYVWRDQITLWSDAVKKSPLSADAHAGLGMAYMIAGRLEEAVRELERANEIVPRNAFVLYYSGVAFFETKEYDKAVKAFRAVWEMGLDSPQGKPSIDNFYLTMARSFLAHGDLDRGGELLKAIGRFRPENAKARELLEKLEKGNLTIEDLRPEGW